MTSPLRHERDDGHRSLISSRMSAPTIELTGIYIYPVKSLRGVSVREAALESGRVAGDRDWLLVDAAGRFMHQRDYPQMARVDLRITAHGISVRADGLSELRIARTDSSAIAAKALTHVRLWRRSAPVMRVSPEVDAWFTEALAVRCHLMAFVPGAPAFDVPSSELNASLQDATPFHLTAEDSLADLNHRIADNGVDPTGGVGTSAPIPMNRFRPNLVVRGAEPYAEDRWRTVAVGDSTLRWVKPCTRCVMTTTDQETGTRASKEPLHTLAKFRRWGSDVVFGHYFVADTWGDKLRVGDKVTVLD